MTINIVNFHNITDIYIPVVFFPEEIHMLQFIVVVDHAIRHDEIQ